MIPILLIISLSLSKAILFLPSSLSREYEIKAEVAMTCTILVCGCSGVYLNCNGLGEGSISFFSNLNTTASFTFSRHSKELLLLVFRCQASGACAVADDFWLQYYSICSSKIRINELYRLHGFISIFRFSSSETVFTISVNTMHISGRFCVSDHIHIRADNPSVYWVAWSSVAVVQIV